MATKKESVPKLASDQIIHQGVIYKLDKIGDYSIGLLDLAYIGGLLACVYFTFKLASASVMGWQMYLCLGSILILGYGLVHVVVSCIRKANKGILSADLVPDMVPAI